MDVMSTRHRSPEPKCQIVRTLDIVGEKWSLLIVRDAMRGLTRFSEFRDSLRAPTDILSARLARLVETGILEKRVYREEGQRERASYHLTEAGHGLKVVLASMMQWNDRFDPAPAGAASVLVGPKADSSVEAPLALAFVDPAGRTVEPGSVAIVPGPGGTWRSRA